jgi:hypothetical protein
MLLKGLIVYSITLLLRGTNDQVLGKSNGKKSVLHLVSRWNSWQIREREDTKIAIWPPLGNSGGKEIWASFSDSKEIKYTCLTYGNPHNEVCPSVCRQNPMSYDNLSCVSYTLLTFYQLFTGEERMIPVIFDDFHFCRSRVIGLDMTENGIMKYKKKKDRLKSQSMSMHCICFG